MKKEIKILCTLGPSSLNQKVIRRLDDIGVDLFRLNLSHISLDRLEPMIKEIQKYSATPVCLDTEGAQIRTGDLKGPIAVRQGAVFTIQSKPTIDGGNQLPLKPYGVVKELRVGDLLSIDYDAALLQITAAEEGKLITVALYEGSIASNKGVSVSNRKVQLSPLTDKDVKAIQMGLKFGIKDIALSFVNRKSDVALVRRLFGKHLFIISKIENHNALVNLEHILPVSDAILIDRGDLSKEESVINIPFLQKMVIKKANALHKPVYVATNLLESMINKKSPTRAEVNDVVNTLIDGADGLVLAAETAIGSHPVGSANIIRTLIRQYENYQLKGVSFNSYNENPSYLLVPPHGGLLIDRVKIDTNQEKAASYQHKLLVDETVIMDAEQIANGGFSPLEGFMDQNQLRHVLNEYHLPNGEIWPMPIILQAAKDKIRTFKNGEKIALVNKHDNAVYAVLHLSDIYKIDFKHVAKKWFKTGSVQHPGVRRLKEGGDYCLGGKIDLVKKREFPFSQYALNPKDTRIIFEHRGWHKVIGFHTRNVIHRAHEYIQMKALRNLFADGIFVHPLVGPKKKHDFSTDVIVKSYEIMLERYYPKGKVLFAVFPSYARYAGPREAVFTALCRKNYGCTHFIVGRDHTGVGNFYKPSESQELFKSLKGLGIEPIFFSDVGYCRTCKKHVENNNHTHKDIFAISGSRIRDILKEGKRPPSWLMREKISATVARFIKKGTNIFVA